MEGILDAVARSNAATTCSAMPQQRLWVGRQMAGSHHHVNSCMAQSLFYGNQICPAITKWLEKSYRMSWKLIFFRTAETVTPAQLVSMSFKRVPVLGEGSTKPVLLVWLRLCHQEAKSRCRISPLLAPLPLIVNNRPRKLIELSGCRRREENWPKAEGQCSSA